MHLLQNHYTSKEVMEILHYRDRSSFWAAVYREGIPHVRITARKILFPKAAFAEWMSDRAA